MFLPFAFSAETLNWTVSFPCPGSQLFILLHVCPAKYLAQVDAEGSHADKGVADLALSCWG